jgi:hypothetical protein
MANAEMLQPYVQQKVAEFLGIEKVSLDPDGDIPIRYGSTVCFARLLEGPGGPMLRVFSPFLRGVKKTTKLLERLNDLNARAPYVRLFWLGDQVFCATDLLAENLQPEEIRNAISAVSFAADALDDPLKKEFGGERMIEEAGAEKPPSATSYL